MAEPLQLNSPGEKPTGLIENKEVAKEGGTVAGLRRGYESRTGKPVITKKNAVDFSKLIEDVSEKTIKIIILRYKYLAIPYHGGFN